MTTAALNATDPRVPEGNCLGSRSVADLSSLLVELSRLMKTVSFYPPDSRERKASMERTYLTWQADLSRSGPLTLCAGEGQLECVGLEGAIDSGIGDTISEQLGDHRIVQLDFCAGLERQAFRELARLLAGNSSNNSTARLDPTAWSLASDGIAAVVGATREASEVEGEAEKPALVDDLLGPEPDGRAAEFLEVLQALEDCDSDDDYVALARQIEIQTPALSREGFENEVYRTALVLADHAVGAGGRSATQARLAQSLLDALFSEALLPDLIARASTRAGSESVRAAQVLLQLGSAAAGPLFDALLRETDRERSAQLGGLIVALGDRVIDTLQRHLQRPGGSQARAAARLAGELQNPILAPTLAGLLSAPDAALRKEAARALVTIGGTTAVDSLTVALSNPDDGLAELAALCLGELRDPRAVAALVRELERTASAGRLDCSREIAKALGQIGAEEAVRQLAAVLGLRGFARRKKRRELKLAAVNSLSKLPGNAARHALREAADHADPRVRERAAQLLRRKQSSTSR